MRSADLVAFPADLGYFLSWLHPGTIGKLVLELSLPWLRSGSRTGQSEYARFHASLRSSRNPESSVSERAALGCWEPNTTLVTAMMGPADQAGPSVTDPRVCPLPRGPASTLFCSLPVILVKGVFLPLQTHNIAQSLPRVQDQTLPLCTVPRGLMPGVGLAMADSGCRHWLWTPGDGDGAPDMTTQPQLPVHGVTGPPPESSPQPSQLYYQEPFA